jgi:hypothetical protein
MGGRRAIGCTLIIFGMRGKEAISNNYFKLRAANSTRKFTSSIQDGNLTLLSVLSGKLSHFMQPAQPIQQALLRNKSRRIATHSQSNSKSIAIDCTMTSGKILSIDLARSRFVTSATNPLTESAAASPR